MGLIAPQSPCGIFIRARQKLGLTQAEMAHAVASSLRTVSRVEAGESTPDSPQLHKLASLLYPLHADLAREAASAGGTTLEQLGMVKPAPAPEPKAAPPPPAPTPSPAPAAPAPVPAHLLVNAVVYAVASALEAVEGAPVSLARARTAVAAAFTSARDLRLSVEEAAAAVAPAAAKEPQRSEAPAGGADIGAKGGKRRSGVR